MKRGNKKQNYWKNIYENEGETELSDIHVYTFICHLLFSNPQDVTEKLKILINNFFFKSFQFTIISGNIRWAISDHLIQFVNLGDFMKPSSTCKANTY